MGGHIKIKDDYGYSLKSMLKVNEQECEFKVNIYSLIDDDTLSLVDITRSKGDLFVFKKVYDKLLEAIPDLLIEGQLDDTDNNDNNDINDLEREVFEEDEEDLQDDMDMI